MKLEHILGNTYMTEVGITSVALYIPDKQNAVIIDTGSEGSEAFKELLEREGITVRAVLNTHLHYDHILNNSMLCRKYGCMVYASPDEIYYAKCVLDEKNESNEVCKDRLYYYSFCKDFMEFLNKNPKDGKMSLSELGIKGYEERSFTFISAPGHSAGHQIIVTPDGVCCIGDTVMTHDVLKESKLPYLFVQEDAVKSMKRLKTLDYSLYIASHKGLMSGEDAEKTVDENIRKEEEVKELLLRSIPDTCSVKEIDEILMRAAGITHPRIISTSWMHEAVLARILEFAKLGAVTIDGETITGGKND